MHNSQTQRIRERHLIFSAEVLKSECNGSGDEEYQRKKVKHSRHNFDLKYTRKERQSPTIMLTNKLGCVQTLVVLLTSPLRKQ